jgi:hypothetical protein
MKYVIRRAILGVVSIPVVAGTYIALYAFLVLAGADSWMSFDEVFDNGVNIAIVVAIILTFYPQFSRLVDKLSA